MDLFKLVAKLTLDSSEYDRGLAAAKATAGKSGGSIATDMERTKKRVTMAAMAVGAAVAAFGVSSVKTKAQFDTAMSQVAATMGKSVSSMNQEVQSVDLAWGKFTGNLSEYAQEMGKHTRYSAIESAEALNYMALAGYSTKESMQMLPNVMNLAAAGSFDLATASDMVTDAQSALGLEIEDTNLLVDQMAKTSATTNTSVAQLGEAILQVGGTAKGLKGGTAELGQVLGILADNSIKGAEGGTALRNILLGIQSKKFETTFGKMGISAYDAEGNLRSLSDVFTDMNKAMDGMTKQERDKLISSTFNRQDLRSVNALLGTTTERWEEVEGAIASASEGGVLYRGKLLSMEEAQKKYGDAIYDTEKGFQVLGAAEFMAMTQMDNLEGDVTLLKSAFEGLKISVGEKLEPIFRALVQGLTELIEHADTLGPIILGLASAFAVFGLGMAIPTLIQNLQMLWMVMKANPILLIASLIAGLIVWLVSLYNSNEEFRNKVNAVWDAVKTAISLAVENIKATIDTLRGIVTSIAQTFEDVKATITSKLDEAKQKVRDAIQAIKNMFPFSLGKIFTDIKLPKFSVSGGKFPYGIGGEGSPPKFSVSWNKKAQLNPYMFTDATLFGAGEGSSDEMLYGHDALMNDIREASGMGFMQAEFDRLVAILEEWLPQLADLAMVLDTGALVGELTTDIDRAMGRRQSSRNRGNAR